jgi:hypothetical protein
MREMRSTRYWGWLLWMAIILSAIAHSQMAVSLIPGDVTGDNWVDDGDLLAILSSFGDANPNLDITGDGIVDDADLLLVLTFLGQNGTLPFSGQRQPASGAVRLTVLIEVLGYRQGSTQLPIVVEAQKSSGGVVYRQEGMLWSNPGEIWINVPEPGRYRVQVAVRGCLIGETDSNEAFTLLRQNGSVLQGEVKLGVSLPFPNYRYGQITLRIDGTEWDFAGDILLENPLRVEFLIPTELFTNGNKLIEVRDTYGHITSGIFMFNNQIHDLYVSPYFSPIENRNCEIQARMVSSQPWRVEIWGTDTEEGQLIRSYSGFGSTISVRFDGRDSSGNLIEDDVYEVRIYANNQLVYRKLTSKMSIGEAFILLDKSVFPCSPPHDSVSYKRYIRSRLSRLYGISFNRWSFFITDPMSLLKDFRINAQRGTISQSAWYRINAHFYQRLHVFYVCSHGEIDPVGGPYFAIGVFTWYSRPIPARPFAVSITDYTQYVGYGNFVDPPGLVWIDSCWSAGKNGVDDFSFATAFASGTLGYGVFVGWNGLEPPGSVLMYGQCSSCRWTRWREQFWFQVTVPNNFQTSLMRTNNFTTLFCPPELIDPVNNVRMYGAPWSNL